MKMDFQRSWDGIATKNTRRVISSNSLSAYFRSISSLPSGDDKQKIYTSSGLQPHKFSLGTCSPYPLAELDHVMPGNYTRCYVNVTLLGFGSVSHFPWNILDFELSIHGLV